MTRKGNLTLRYAVTQVLYFAAECGTITFAATYLLNSGFAADKVGIVLFGAHFVSFILEQLTADIADRADKNVLPMLIFGLSVISVCALGAVRFLNPPLIIFGILYAAGMFSFATQVPLINSLSVYYCSRSWKLNYGIGRGMGSLGFALVSPLFGRLLESSMQWVLPINMALILLTGISVFFYPKDDSEPVIANQDAERLKGEEAVSLFEFFAKYKWYAISLAGVMCIGFIHMMTENYLIEVMRLHGGDSADVGTAFFYATIAEIPGIVFFSRFHKKFGTYKLFAFAALTFFVKMVLYFIAGSVTALVIASTLQFCSYGFYCPVQVYYANECISAGDMVKGQSTIYASHCLGGALGNLIGGIIIEKSGVRAMLILSIVLGAIGLAILIFTIPKAIKAAKEIEA